MEPESNHSWRRDLGLLRQAVLQVFQHKVLLVLTIAATAASAGLVALPSLAVSREVFDVLAPAGGRHALSTEAATRLTRMAWPLLLVAPLAGLAAYAAWFAGQQLANRCMLDFRRRFLSHLVQLELAFHSRMARGDLITRLGADMAAQENLFRMMFGKMFQQPVEIIVWLVALVWQDWSSALPALLVLLPVGLLLLKLFGRTRRRSHNARTRLAETMVVLEQVTAGIRVIKAMGSGDRELAAFDHANRRLFDANLKVARSRATTELVSYTATFLVISVILLALGWQLSHGRVETGTLGMFLATLARLATLTRTAQRTWLDAVNLLPASHRLQEILERPPQLRDEPQAGECPVPCTTIRLEEATFAYDTGAQPVLDRCSLEIPVGKTIAIVGESGAGKSTLLDLLPRFHDVQGGRITIDGTDIRSFTQASLVRHFAIVQQESFLFDDTVEANIRYGRINATQAEVEQAARRAHVHEAILGLEGGLGYATPVGDRGSRLSGGQRQRVAIARALLRDAPVLLLDEPTSALDAGSEAHVQAALAELMAGRTTVMVAHRLATIRHADCIYVLDKDTGRVAESGTHDELVARGGLYTRMVERQRLG